MPACDPCACCKCKRKPVLKPCYKQPNVAESCAPCTAYVKPTAPLEASTTYKLSYLRTGCGDARTAPIRPGQSIIMSCEPMQDDTVHQLSYRPNPVCVTRPTPPRNHRMFNSGPISAITTQKHDYVPKPIDLRDSFRPDTEYHCVEAPFESRTVNKLSYLPPGRLPMPKSCAPIRSYEPPCAPMNASTTHKMSYQPNKVQPRVHPPWANAGPYLRPSQPIDSSTVYKMSFLDAKTDCRRSSVTPPTTDNPVTSSKNFEAETVYRNSYLPARACVSPPVIPVASICVSTAPIDGDTVQKLSYLPNPLCVTQPTLPRNHQMFGTGPISAVTTQKHDYVSKPIDLRDSFKPDTKYHSEEAPFESRTVNRLSYLNPGRVPPIMPCKRVRAYQKPDIPIESVTVQKMSYQPVKPRRLMTPPWASRGQYLTPTCRMEGNTIYRSSFLPPGEDCSEVAEPCTHDREPMACNRTTPTMTMPTEPCVCRYPKAECCA